MRWKVIAVPWNREDIQGTLESLEIWILIELVYYRDNLCVDCTGDLNVNNPISQ